MKELIVVIVFIGLCVSLIVLGPNLYEYFGSRYEDAYGNIMDNNYAKHRGDKRYTELLKLEAARETKPEVKQALLDQVKILESEY
jgi:hypothetical protein